MQLPIDQKQMLYHAVLGIIKEAESQQKAASEIIQLMEEFVSDKMAEMLEENEEGQMTVKPKVSPIFRRSQ